MQDHHQKHLSSRTDQVISRAHKQWSHEPDHQSAFLNNPGSASHNSLHVDSSPSTSMILSPGGTPRRHVVNHSQNEIRDALHVARHDHMSSADCFVSVDQLTGILRRLRPLRLSLYARTEQAFAPLRAIRALLSATVPRIWRKLLLS